MLNDLLYGRADVHLPPFYAIADWKDFGRALNEIGFDGAVSLECNPPAKLSDLSFENMSRAYAQLAADIIF